MKNIPLLLFAIILLISCVSPSKKKNTNFGLPKNTEYLVLNPQPFISSMAGELNENSGLIYYDGLLWTFNDSGGKNRIYGFDFSGKIQKEVELKDSENVDWEEIAQDDNYIYVGDFGNNSGRRKDLKIYQIKKKDINEDSEQKIKSKKIEFSYKNQTDFSFQNQVTPFDCEAFIVLGNNLHLFSKNWHKRTTEVYKVNLSKGNHFISPVDSFNVQGLITGADISADKTKLALIGYEDYIPFLWIFSEIHADSLFKGSKTHITLNAIEYAQTEGICFLGNDTLLISCEENNVFRQQVFLIDLKSIENGTLQDQ